MMDLRLGDVVQLKKQHPCGGNEWEVVRLGADIGLRCRLCQHRVLIPRASLERRVKGWISRGPATDKRLFSQGMPVILSPPEADGESFAEAQDGV